MKPFALAAFAFLLLTVSPASAQEFGRVAEIQSSVGPYYVHVVPGRPSTQVQVWGAVRAPGLYEVDQGTDLGKLLTLAGGPPVGMLQDRRIREVTVRLYRNNAGTRTLVYEADLEAFIERPTLYPQLSDGDLVMVDAVERQTFGWREGIAIVSAVGTITSVFLYVVRLSR
jgi:hypothetical protein